MLYLQLASGESWHPRNSISKIIDRNCHAMHFLAVIARETLMKSLVRRGNKASVVP